MKKFKLTLVLCMSLFLLTSCTKTKFEDLPKEKQEEIVQYTIGIVAPEVGKALQQTLDFSLSDEERDKITAEFEVKLEQIFEEQVKTKFSNVIFGTYEEFNAYTSKVDNSREIDNKKTPKEIIRVKLGEFHEFSNGEDEKLKLKVNDITWVGKEYGDYWIETAKNDFLFIRLEGENIGKKPTFKWLGEATLVTKDGYEFKAKTTEQNPDNLKDGYSGCIECELNPLGKAEQSIVFDIPKIDLAGALLKFESDGIEFEL